jgi:hypothetical protein
VRLEFAGASGALGGGGSARKQMQSSVKACQWDAPKKRRKKGVEGRARGCLTMSELTMNAAGVCGL